jgi:hypothetical protein
MTKITTGLKTRIFAKPAGSFCGKKIEQNRIEMEQKDKFGVLHHFMRFLFLPKRYIDLLKCSQLKSLFNELFSV